MTLADKIEALTDEECLSLMGPWRVEMVLTAGCTVLFGPDAPPEVFAAYVDAVGKRDELNAAHVRARLRGLMTRPATCG